MLAEFAAAAGLMICGGGLTILGISVGEFRERRKQRSLEGQPVCRGCGHHQSYHRDGRSFGPGCEKKVRGWTCECQKYSGPTPLPEYYAPEL